MSKAPSAADVAKWEAGEGLRTEFAFERDRFRKLNGQFFIRYANRYGLARNFIDAQRDLQKTQIINMGLSLNFF